MNFKKYFIIFTLFLVLFVSIGVVSAESCDSVGNVTSQVDDSVLQSENDSLILNSQESDVKVVVADDNVLQEEQSSYKLAAAGSPSKSPVKLVTYANFVKKGSYYYGKEKHQPFTSPAGTYRY